MALIDIIMPGLSDLELLGAIKEKDPGLQVMMITAHGTTDRMIKVMKLGIYEYIQKPFDIPKVWETIRKALLIAESVRSLAILPDGPKVLLGRGNKEAGELRNHQTKYPVNCCHK